MHIKAYDMCDAKKPITIVINCVFNPVQWEKLFEMSEEASQQIIDEYPSQEF